MNSYSKSRFTVLIIIAMFLGSLPASFAQAKPLGRPLAAKNLIGAVTFTVNSTLDQPDDLSTPGTCHTAANTCTLRAAIMQANRTSGAGATIIVPAGLYKLTIPAVGANDESNGDLNLTSPASGDPVITIVGAGSSKTIIDANQIDRVFHVYIGRRATISGVTIRNGYVAETKARGGGIYNEGILTVSNATLLGNYAKSFGGGIANNGGLTVVNSTLSQNNSYWGGGIEGSGLMDISSSTISGNSASDGGGIFSQGNLFLENSTISGNQVTGDGGGVYNFNTGGLTAANVYNTSIVFNGADSDQDFSAGGGVYNQAGAIFNLRNSLVAGNYMANAPVYQDCRGTLNSYGRNLFGDVTGCTVNAALGSWGLVNSLDYIAPLQNHGGATLTHALLPGSNAIDGGDPAQGCVGQDSLPLAADQRGAARVTGASCDIGAFEYVPALTLKSSGANDGWVLETSETSSLGGSINPAATTFRLGDDATKKQYRGLLSFNTASLPDNAVITKLTLKVQQQAIVGGGNPVTAFQGFMVDIKRGFFGTTAGLVAGDFQATASKTFGPFKPVPIGGWYSLNLTPGQAYINKLTTSSGLTQIRLRFNLDDNNNAVANYLSLFSGNAPATSRPQLIIEYYAP